jgi:hypothetical protein
MTYGGDLARPDLPRPNCRVKLVCGPPAAGKSTYVKQHARPGDIVIDLDSIAREYGFTRYRPPGVAGILLQDRNDRLVALAYEPAERMAWVIITAPSRSLRTWWCQMLGIQHEDLIVLVPPRDELHRRIMADPDRAQVRKHQLELVAKWFIRERDNDPGAIKSGYDVNGYPLDPLHSWNLDRGVRAADRLRNHDES